jgi:hypothetical protein
MLETGPRKVYGGCGSVARWIDLRMGGSIAFHNREKGARLGWMSGEGRCGGCQTWVRRGHLNIGVAGQEAFIMLLAQAFSLEEVSVFPGR